MKKQIGKRLLSFVLVLVMVLGMVPVACSPKVSAATDEFGVENSGYIDLPTTVMDFLGNGLLMESYSVWSSPYSLSESAGPITITTDTGEQLTAEFPGTRNKYNYEANLNTAGDAFRILGLAEDYLANGSIVYTDATVTYIAYALFNKVDANNVLGGTISNSTRYNKHIMKLVQDGLPDGLGSLSDTYGKCHGGKGGELFWTEIRTCFDLAYYMLHYMWAPVSGNDHWLYNDDFKGKTIPVHYNLTVPEIQKIRLYKQNVNGQELYVFDSKGTEAIANETLYNSSANSDGNNPNFKPLKNLGYQSDAYYGHMNTTSSWNTGVKESNFCFTLHAEGAFVYWEESDLFFEFCGDDDVYFFVNDQLVCDIGGVHGERLDYVYLNDLVEAGTLQLEEGQICTFDMFYAERHTSGINMRLSTNIELMDYDLLTQKKQFDASTGLEYPSGQAVPYGTAIDYRFSILNRKQLPASEVNFTDEKLGVELSGDTIRLSASTVYQAGDDLSAEGLEIFYLPYEDDGSVTTESMVTLGSYEELQAAIVPLTSGITIPQGQPPRIQTPYRYVVKTAQELAEIMDMGVPGYCEFAVYGIERTLEKQGSAGGDRVILANGVGLYSNTLQSLANPGTLQDNSAEMSVVYVTTVSGVSTCRIKGFDFGEVSSKEPLQLVADYGKDIKIPIGTMQDAIDYDRRNFAVDYVGFELPTTGESGSKGGLVTRTLPTGLTLTEAGETKIPGKFGTFKRAEADTVCFEMTDFMESVERAYAVFSVIPLNDPDSGNQTAENEVIAYLYLEIRIIPANMMYYEAEDFTDTEISYTQVGGSYPNWATKKDNTGSSDYQDFDPVGYRTYDMVADRDNIPAEAFFADFDGTGYVDRYRTQPQYKGYDFDEYFTIDPETGTVTGKLYAKNWVINTANGSYAEIDPKTGTLSFGLHEGKNSIYVQSGVSLDGTIPGPLKLIPGKENVAQIRFKVENIELDTEKEMPYIRLYYYDHDSTDESKLQNDGVTFPAEYLENGAYYTATIPLSDEKYGSEPIIDRIRVQLFNVRSKAGGRVTIDYIYVGPVSGMKQNIYDDYLYFTFDNTDADKLRYKGSQYGSTASAIRNYDTNTYWKAAPTANTCSISGGNIVLTDNTDSANSPYNSIHAGTSDKEAPFTYRLTGNDVYRIRFKITPKAGETIQRDPGDKDQDPYIALEVGKGGIPAACLSFPLERYTDGQFHTLTLPVNTAHLAKNNISVLTYIRPTFSYIKGAVYTIDYIYVGPANLADEVTGKADHLFFDFTNSDNAKSRYSNPVYGTYGKNFDIEGWHNNHTYATSCPNNLFNTNEGTMSFQTTAAYYTGNITTIALATASRCHFSQDHPLNFALTGNEYFKVRMKIEGATDTSANFIVRYADGPTSNNANAPSSFDCTIPATAIENGEFFTLEGYITFGTATKITALRFDVYNLAMSASNKPITITYDYIYVGPYNELKLTTDNLYFGFDNTPEDQARYANYTYGGYNFDESDTYSPYGIGQWATSNVVNSTSYDYTIDNEKGLLNIGVSNGFTGAAGSSSQIYGPYLVTTDRYGEYNVSESTAKLKYRPDNAYVAQLRFRVKNCQIIEGQTPRVVFLFGGYNADGVYTDYNGLPTMYQRYTPEDGFITLSIPLHQGFRDLALVTNIGFRIQNIYSPDHTGVVELDYFYVGTGEGAPNTYGYDSSYNTANLYSNGVSLYTEGNGVRTDANPNPAKYTETRFSFTGTGFDLISRTNPDQGLIRVEIYTDPSYHKDFRLEGASVNMKGELDLYQIPVYSKHKLPYGTYYVSVMVNGAINFPALPALSRGNQFFLDAIRIYDPIDVTQGENAPAGTDSAVAYAAYCSDVEAHVIVKEVREILLSAETFDGISGMTDGAVYVDYKEVPTVTTPTTSEGTGGEDITDPDLVDKVENHITSDILTYNKIGPNNETYLGPQQLVAFQLLVFSSNIPNRLDIGAKAITEDPTMLSVKILDTANGQDLAYTTTVQGSAQQYYNLYLENDTFKSKIIDGKKCYITTIIISNPRVKNTVNVDKILSITDIRVGYKEPAVISDPEIGTPTKRNTGVELPEDEFVPVRFVVTSELGDIVNQALENMYKPCTHTPGQWEILAHPGVGRDGVAQIRCTRCGEILETKITEGIPTLTFAGASVSLQSDLAIHYKVNESFFTEQGYTDPYVVVTDNGIETVIRDYTVSDGRLSFVYKNIAPHRIGDTVTATLYAYYNGTLYSSESRDYSIADYCYNMLNRYGGQEAYGKLLTLLVDILHYGAKTQEFAGYRTDSLCNARLTEAQLSWGTELTRELVNLRDQNYEVIENPTVQWKGAGLNLQESVAVRFCMVAESYEDLEIRITLNGITESYTAEDFDYKSNGTYVHFTKLNAAQMSEPILVAAYRNGEQVSNTICYSIESYAYAKQNDTTYPYLGELVERMICYGDSARAYVGK